MKVALIGASGNVGSRIVAELAARGHEITAIARHPENVKVISGVTPVKGDLFDVPGLAHLLAGHDAVLSSVLFVNSEPDKLMEAVRKSGVARYLVVGGAGSLEVAPGMKLVDTPQFPEAYRQEAILGGLFLDSLREEKVLDWTFLSPSALFGPGERTGKFRLGSDQLLSNETGSSISYEDYAVALVDELEKPQHSRSRFTVGY